MSLPPGYAPGELIGPYPVEGAAGWGGFADVFKSHARDGTPVVVKVGMRRGGMASRTFAQNVLPARAVQFATGSAGFRSVGADDVAEIFRAEARALRSAAGARLPRLIDELHVDGRPVLVMERLSAPWPLDSAPIQDFPRILEACADLWRAGLEGHGDLKPEHVFVDASGEFVFIDPAYVGEGLRTLTPEYHTSGADGRRYSDVFAVAVMLYRRLTGEFPAASRCRAEMGPRPALQRRLAESDRDANHVLSWVDAALGAGRLVGELTFGVPILAEADDRIRWHAPHWMNDQVTAATRLRAAIDGHRVGWD